MNLINILQDQYVSSRGPAPNLITHIHYDSRKVSQNGCFVCISGDNTDGHLFIDTAVQKGAIQIIGDNEHVINEQAAKYPFVQFVLVKNPKKSLALYSSHLHDHAHKDMSLIGVTGTQGKTTITAYTRYLLNGSGIKTGSIGTAGIWDNTKSLSLHKSTPTTPESSDLHSYLATMLTQDISTCVMEATSIGLDQERLHGLHFDIAVHSNLYPEHLDYHGTFEEYKRAKLRLFDGADVAIVNKDDDGMARDIITSFDGRIWTYAIENHAKVRATDIEVTTEGTYFTLHIQKDTHPVFIPVLGIHNVYNFLASLCTCLAKGISLHTLLPLFETLEGPPGRLQVVSELDDRHMIFDFSHTPAALENLLETVKPLPRNRLILMVTGIGIREKELRAPIAAAVEGKADEIVVTSDHPGDEEPEDVVRDVLDGFTEVSPHIHPVPQRGDAIKKAMELAEAGDLILITGICMEDFQIVKGEKVPYHDYDHVKDFLASRMSSVTLSQIGCTPSKDMCV
ncbi:UDP-N-acetylmuramoyl-L-alanyl-D-glutamate--2,6-diaminopimelate ligase [Paenalkalicoccus suaedae]|uniref:UDP-N-acetylmuramyl-tripeptide synthetase n=1 Tax=Paenalkalicoccus suaedae TaxID=2592382 RepID=A0A859FB77_9BACI|nr:UDP-N-acetylmuramoyl-L-alanyl-D-glutamate--2,6-diaminopimelate ligase [Paenalkalicoccus suaedae]QKS69911.1 UDP-N-acetylmuramoyl-L-alanyl-D-glutamate--2,6-diaminopimelate ligase [Paenalkalicoccus suaedae]